MAANQLVARKHWIVYFSTIVIYGIWFLILAVMFLSVLAASQQYPPHSDGQFVVFVLGSIILVVFLLSTYLAFSSLMLSKSITWTLTEDGLATRSGWLSWKKRSFLVPYETIFEAYYQVGFFANLLGYHKCTIRRTEGVTSSLAETAMTNVPELVRAVNAKVKELRAMQFAGPQMISLAPRVEPAKSQAEQLRELSALKADGTITAEEFDLMKRKIIQA